MHYSQREKYEIIRLVEQSDLGVIRTLRQLKVNKTTFYNWYKAYLENGYDGLKRKQSGQKYSWNRINEADRDKVVEIALEKPELSSRELAWHITDTYSYYVSESSVYRILKANGLITTPSFRVMSASDSFHDKTTSVNQMWQTDFTYFKIYGWGWYEGGASGMNINIGRGTSSANVENNIYHHVSTPWGREDNALIDKHVRGDWYFANNRWPADERTGDRTSTAGRVSMFYRGIDFAVPRMTTDILNVGTYYKTREEKRLLQEIVQAISE